MRWLGLGTLVTSLLLPMAAAQAGGLVIVPNGAGPDGPTPTLAATMAPPEAPAAPQPRRHRRAKPKAAAAQSPAARPRKEGAPHAAERPQTDYVHPVGAVRFDRERLRTADGRQMVALTFDDGPDAVYTPQVAAILKDNGVTATFFLVGSQAAAIPAGVRRLVEEGHEVGPHSHTHGVPLTRLSQSALESDFDRSLAAVVKSAGTQDIRWFRPPYGSSNDAVLRAAQAHGLDTIRWDIDPEDWKTSHSADYIANSVLSQLHPGAVILLHSINGRTVAALPEILRRGREMGYEFVTVSRLWGAAVPRSPKNSGV